MSDDYPYRAEYAKTGRAGCKKCKAKIDQGILRLAAMVQSYHHDGKDPHWFHENCFFEKHRPQSSDQIDHFESIRIEDQQSIKKKITEMLGMPVPGAKAKKATKGKKRSAEVDDEPSSSALIDFGIEYSKSSRAVCTACEIKIMKEEIRIKKIAYDTEVGMKFGGQAIWHHLECFAKIRDEYSFFLNGKLIPGFKDLSKSDQAEVVKALPEVKSDQMQSKKLKGEPKDEADIAAEKKLEEAIAKETKKFFKWKDELKSFTKGDLQNFLFVNGSGMVEGKENLEERSADFLTFGALAKCKLCKTGDFVFKKNNYLCNGDQSEWAKCENTIEKPPRKTCKIPSDWKKRGEPWDSFKSKVQDRTVRPAPLKFAGTGVKKEGGAEIHEPKVKRERPPLYNMHLVIIGKTVISKVDLKKTIEKLGGKLVTKLNEQTAVVISNRDEIDKMNSRMMEVKEFDIQVVPETFLESVKAGGAIEKIKSMNMSSWGSDPLSRIPQEEAHKPKESMYTKHASKKETLMLKGGSAVDPKCQMADICHVYKEGKKLYSVVLGLTDIQRGKNSYYKLQVLQSDTGNRFWLFRSWGRIGTTVGDSRTESFNSADSACEQFEFHYQDKSGNPWEYNGTDLFNKKPQKYSPIDVDYGDDEKAKKTAENSIIKSELPKQVQELMKMLFDVDTMKKTMLEFELDLEKMPLGRLSKKQLQSAYTCLTDLNKLIEKGGTNAEFIGSSNKFYTLVPHSFGVQNPPLIDTVEMIKNKIDMIDNLLEIEIAYNLMNSDTDSDKNPLDAHYEQLKTELVPLKKDSEEFQLIEKYVQNTHAATHDTYTLDVEDVFKVDRKAEKRRYKPFKKLHNRQLLWHGSRLTNYVGILSHGLKIAPPEAPVTGYMFGKGIYFADMVSKSANYCCTNRQNSTGFMLLSEVALGDTHDLTKSVYIEKLPKDKHSTKGIGKTQPNPAEFHTREDGVVIPLGTPYNDPKLKTELLYNEFIVYDVAQVNIQYMLKLKFNYKK